MLLTPPALVFKQRRVDAPIQRSVADYRTWYRSRLSSLGGGTAFYTPPAICRKLFFARPDCISNDVVGRLARSLTTQLLEWTKVRFTSEITPAYNTLDQGVAELQRSATSGMVVFVFDRSDPAAYFEIEYRLRGWRVKRITGETLINKMASGESQSFIRMCALDVLQKLGCIPWKVEPLSDFEAELCIDVGEDRRQFSLSLVVNRDNANPDLYVATETHWKADVRKEEVNPEVLRDSAVQIFRGMPYNTPLRSLLVFRDGGFCGEELDGLKEALGILRGGPLGREAQVVMVDVHKYQGKGLRLWDVGQNGISNVLEGTALRLDSGSALICCTGAATLHRLTAEPLLLMCREQGNIDKISQHFFVNAQFNFSSPSVAQRLTLGLKRTDEELGARAAQEIRRVR